MRQRRASAPLRSWRPLPLHSYFFLATAALRLPAAFARLVAPPGLKLTTRILRPSRPSMISSINFSIRWRRLSETPRLLAVLGTEGKGVLMTAFCRMFEAYFRDQGLVKHNPLRKRRGVRSEFLDSLQTKNGVVENHPLDYMPSDLVAGAGFEPATFGL